MEIVDELMTPGCPQCAIKHLSAALAYLLAPGRHGFWSFSRKWLAVAKINLAEVLVGYKSHLWYAVGMLQRAEETALAEGRPFEIARHARILLEDKGLAGAEEALRKIECGTEFEPEEMAGAHLYEAARELPQEFNYPIVPDAAVIVRMLENVRESYFDSAEGTVPEASNNQGEPEMATKKAPAKKAVAKKAVQAACKGGKCKPGKSCKK